MTPLGSGHERLHRDGARPAAGARLARIATVGPDGQPHVVPLTFTLNEAEDTIDVGGIGFGSSKKWRDANATRR